ncbi:MAG: septal ring lytic transglycosylase RlpA family protein [Thermoleophilia bacterium]|nr:septal ring lytic transglycosylase RlpA family protein [Thermoleophilia bacterium]
MFGISAAVLALVMTTPHGLNAAELAHTRSDVASGEHRVHTLQRKLASTDARIAGTIAKRDDLVVTVQARLVAIYKSPETSPSVATIIASGGSSVEDTTSAANVVAVVARQDARLLRRMRTMSKDIDQMTADRSRTAHRLSAASRALTADRRSLRKAEAKAAADVAAAKARAIALSHAADSPLLPRAVAPETVASSASQSEAAAPTPPPAQAVSFAGIASMYADSFAGQKTASGGLYDPGAMTAAHPSLPLGTWVTVNGPGGTAMVRINDRGPFVGGRVLDLSRAAANAVGLGGLARVTFSVQN